VVRKTSASYKMWVLCREEQIYYFKQQH
jgi:hypothetical protein